MINRQRTGSRITDYGLLITLLLLAACGFEPLHGRTQSGAAGEALAAVQVAQPKGRLGQIFAMRLEDLFSASGQATPRYRLEAQIMERETPVGIEQDRRIARYDVTLESTFALRDLATGETVQTGKLRSITSYSVVESDYSTFTAKRDAQERAARELAEQYYLRLAAFFTKRGG